jgi:hypothetical protein
VLLSGRGAGTNVIMREARVPKPTVWRWQEAYMAGGVDRLRWDGCTKKRAEQVHLHARTSPEAPMPSVAAS